MNVTLCCHFICWIASSHKKTSDLTNCILVLRPPLCTKKSITFDKRIFKLGKKKFPLVIISVGKSFGKGYKLTTSGQLGNKKLVVEYK